MVFTTDPVGAESGRVFFLVGGGESSLAISSDCFLFIERRDINVNRTLSNELLELTALFDWSVIGGLLDGCGNDSGDNMSKVRPGWLSNADRLSEPLLWLGTGGTPVCGHGFLGVSAGGC